eukprot:TRINITY_DN22_c0_g2_i1.p2 TRINITY_DN22_c0_g2~~TRINITY_DN22_c0_g2_i1.p2  ORF type:complete len:390 (-),score=129.70 TRINITY_DN22_c0_g2_i1:1380-2510(-)
MGNTGSGGSKTKGKKREYKILLLGAGDSGKSTLVKQMHVIHLEGFSDSQKKEYKPIIYSNLVSSMVTLVQATRELNLPVNPENEQLVARFLRHDRFDFNTGHLTAEMARDIKTLWHDMGVRQAYSRSREFQLPDCAAYYFSGVDRLAAADYMPTDQDIVYTPSHTTGFNEVVFQSQNERFRVIDVGGQRSERRKWVQCFQDVSAVIFCVAMSEYDLTLFEDTKESRTEESLRLFRDVCASKWFLHSNIFLFLNKKDILEQKVHSSPLNKFYPEYTGPNEYEPASQFLKNLFTNKVKNREVTVFNTCATDSANIKQVFSLIQTTLVARKDGPAGAGAGTGAAQPSAAAATPSAPAASTPSSASLGANEKHTGSQIGL